MSLPSDCHNVLLHVYAAAAAQQVSLSLFTNCWACQASTCFAASTLIGIYNGCYHLQATCSMPMLVACFVVPSVFLCSFSHWCQSIMTHADAAQLKMWKMCAARCRSCTTLQDTPTSPFSKGLMRIDTMFIWYATLHHACIWLNNVCTAMFPKQDVISWLTRLAEAQLLRKGSC